MAGVFLDYRLMIHLKVAYRNREPVQIMMKMGIIGFGFLVRLCFPAIMIPLRISSGDCYVTAAMFIGF